MSIETKTTVSDYINAMFKMADNMEQPCEQDERRKVLAAANELKEAWERERAEIAAKAAAEAVMLTNEKWKRDGGNAVMLRMAMESVETGLKEVVGQLSDLETEVSVALEHAPDHVENAAALRDALELCLAWYNEETAEGVTVDDVAEKAQKALASKPRNCDKPEFATAGQALAALKQRFPVEEWSGALRMAVNWLYDTMDYCLALPVSRRFGQQPKEGGK